MFHALELSIGLVKSLRTPLEAIRRSDGDLADQLKRAAMSTALNLSEGAGRSGRDQLRFYRIARGSAFEARTALRLAQALGLLEGEAVEEILDRSEHVCAVLNRLLR